MVQPQFEMFYTLSPSCQVMGNVNLIERKELYIFVSNEEAQYHAMKQNVPYHMAYNILMFQYNYNIVIYAAIISVTFVHFLTFKLFKNFRIFLEIFRLVISAH